MRSMASAASSRGIAAIVGVGPNLGRSIARKFAHEGYTVAILARDLGRLSRFADEIAREEKAQVFAIRIDCSDSRSIREAFEGVLSLGFVEVLVYNAYQPVSSCHPSNFADIRLDAFEKSIAVSSVGAFHCSQQVLPGMVDRGRGTILFTGCSASLNGIAGYSELCPSVKRVRGPTRGKNSSRLISQHGGKKLFVGVSIERRTFVGLNATKAANELGAQIRLQAPLQGTKNWEDVPPVIRAAIVQSLRDKFEIEGYDESPLPQEIIDTKSTHLFKGWRYHMHEHYKKLVKEGTDPYSKPFVGVSEEDWRYMIDEVFLGDTHQERSTRNIANRKKLPYNHTMGSRSFSAAISIEGIETGKEPHIVDFFKTSHWSKKKKDWIEPVCQELYEKMDQHRKEASQPGATPLTQEEITVQVLGKRSGYLRGFGVGPKPSSTFNSTTRSQARDEEVKGLKEEVASLKGIIQSYEGRFEQFEHFMRQMQGNCSGCDSFDE